MPHSSLFNAVFHPARILNVSVFLPPLYHLSAGKHTIFGRVASGMEVVKRLGNVQTDANDRPVTQVKIVRARPV